MKNFIIKDTDTLRKRVLDYLREQILSGEISAGARLIETDIAHIIGTSRTPVREALHNLEKERLVEAIPRVGYVVRPMREEEVEEICEIRVALEGLAIRRAIQNSPKDLLKELKQNLFKQAKAIEKGDLRLYMELDGSFHEITARLSGSERLLEMTQMLRRHMLHFRSQSIYGVETTKRSMEGHKQIFQAIEKADPGAAVKALERHLKSAKKDVLNHDLQKNEMDLYAVKEIRLSL